MKVASGRAWASWLMLASGGIGCGGSSSTPAAPANGEAVEAPAESGGPVGLAAPAAEGGSPAPAAEGATGGTDQGGAQSLARDLIKSGGRRIGWSATKKGFVHPQQRRSGDSTSLDIVFTDQDGRAKDVMRICQPGECEEHLTELAKEATPKLVARLEGDGFVGLRAIGWPQGRDDLDVSALGMKLVLSGTTLQGTREGKPPLRIGTVKPKLLALFVVPDTKLLGVFTSPDGEPWGQAFSVLHLP